MCTSCKIISINGIDCHELGCPDTWQGTTVECQECGIAFELEGRWQICCSDECAADFEGTYQHH